MNRDDYKSKELVMRERAKMYLDKLIMGINPVDDREIPKDSVVYEPKIVNCFKYLSEYIGEINAKEHRRVERKRRFMPVELSTDEQLHIPVVNAAIPVSELADNINSIVTSESMKRLKATGITTWLLDKDFLEIVTDSNGKNKKVPTQAGLQIGITTEIRHSKRNLGDYTVVLYSKEAQQFIADNICEIIAVNDRKAVEE